MGEEPVSRIHLAEELVPLGAKVLDLIAVSPHQDLSLQTKLVSAVL
jgi:hypothetical protein